MIRQSSEGEDDIQTLRSNFRALLQEKLEAQRRLRCTQDAYSTIELKNKEISTRCERLALYLIKAKKSNLPTVLWNVVKFHAARRINASFRLWVNLVKNKIVYRQETLHLSKMVITFRSIHLKAKLNALNIWRNKSMLLSVRESAITRIISMKALQKGMVRVFNIFMYSYRKNVSTKRSIWRIITRFVSKSKTIFFARWKSRVQNMRQLRKALSNLLRQKCTKILAELNTSLRACIYSWKMEVARLRNTELKQSSYTRQRVKHNVLRDWMRRYEVRTKAKKTIFVHFSKLRAFSLNQFYHRWKSNTTKIGFYRRLLVHVAARMLTVSTWDKLSSIARWKSFVLDRKLWERTGREEVALQQQHSSVQRIKRWSALTVIFRQLQSVQKSRLYSFFHCWRRDIMLQKRQQLVDVETAQFQSRVLTARVLQRIVVLVHRKESSKTAAAFSLWKYFTKRDVSRTVGGTTSVRSCVSARILRESWFGWRQLHAARLKYKNNKSKSLKQITRLLTSKIRGWEAIYFLKWRLWISRWTARSAALRRVVGSFQKKGMRLGFSIWRNWMKASLTSTYVQIEQRLEGVTVQYQAHQAEMTRQVILLRVLSCWRVKVAGRVRGRARWRRVLSILARSTLYCGFSAWRRIAQRRTSLCMWLRGLNRWVEEVERRRVRVAFAFWFRLRTKAVTESLAQVQSEVAVLRERYSLAVTGERELEGRVERWERRRKELVRMGLGRARRVLMRPYWVYWKTSSAHIGRLHSALSKMVQLVRGSGLRLGFQCWRRAISMRTVRVFATVYRCTDGRCTGRSSLIGDP